MIVDSLRELWELYGRSRYDGYPLAVYFFLVYGSAGNYVSEYLASNIHCMKAVPSTRLESEYVGETSEKLVDKAQEVAREAIHSVQSAAQQMGGEGENAPKPTA